MAEVSLVSQNGKGRVKKGEERQGRGEAQFFKEGRVTLHFVADGCGWLIQRALGYIRFKVLIFLTYMQGFVFILVCSFSDLD